MCYLMVLCDFIYFIIQVHPKYHTRPLKTENETAAMRNMQSTPYSLAYNMKKMSSVKNRMS